LGGEFVKRGFEEVIKAAKGLEQFFGQGFDIAPWDGLHEEEFQQFILSQAVGTGFEEAFAQALAVAMIMRFVWHFGCSGVEYVFVDTYIVII